MSALLLAALLPAQGVVNPSLLAHLPDDAKAQQSPLRTVMLGSGPAVVHVAVEVKGRNVFRIERPSSGVVIGKSGLVLTFWSLVREAEGAADKRVLVQLADLERTELPCAIVAHDDASGLALLQAEVPAGTTLPAVALAVSPPAAGTPALVVSNHDGKDQVAFAGVVMAAVGGTTLDGRAFAAKDLLLTDANLDERDQGAGLFDDHGRLLGLCDVSHLARPVPEPTLRDLMAPSFGVVVPAAAAHKAFAGKLGGVHVDAQPGALAPTAAVVQKVAPSIVSVWAGEGELPAIGDLDPYATERRPGLGSGVIVGKQGLVLTNLHVVHDADAVTVRLLDGRKFAARTIKTYAAGNLALLQLDLPAGASVPAAPCGGGEVLLGETVLGIGNPFGHTLTVSQGALSQKRAGGLLQADPNLGNQNGGGALVDLSGRVCGIVDGGAIDKVERAWRRQGDQAKTETNLSTCLSMDAVRQVFAAELAAGAGADESIRTPPAADLAAREDATTRMVQKVAAAMLNVYISWSSAQQDEDSNPFAAAKEPVIMTQSLGSGVVIDGSGLALTNWHVVDDATEPDGSMRKDHVVHVRGFDGKVVEAKVLSISREDDLALLQLVMPADRTLTAVQLGNSTSLQPGETVVAIGNPLGFANTITKGIVSAKNQGIQIKGRWAKMENLLETDAAINGGNSGGALLDLSGRLVGINSAGSHGASARGYAIAVDHVRQQVLGLLLSPEKLRSQNLGLRVVDQDGVVVVATVDPFGPGARAGVVVGDVVQAMGEHRITWSVGFAMTLLHWPAGTAAPLHLERGGKTRTVAVEPMSAAAWAVHRQTGCDLVAVNLHQEPELVRSAWVALQRTFTGDPRAVPAELPETVLRIARVQPGVQKEDVLLKVGDLLLAVELQQENSSGQAAQLRRLSTVAEVQELFNDRLLGSYEGRVFRCWCWRDGAVHKVALMATRLML